MALLVPDNSLLHFSQLKNNFINQNKTFFMWDKYYHVTFCFHLTEPYEPAGSHRNRIHDCRIRTRDFSVMSLSCWPLDHHNSRNDRSTHVFSFFNGILTRRWNVFSVVGWQAEDLWHDVGVLRGASLEGLRAVLIRRLSQRRGARGAGREQLRVY